MSARDTLLAELQRQPEYVARKLLDYLHALVPKSSESGPTTRTEGNFGSYWNHFYGALEGEAWEEPRELPAEKREEW